jgi:succinate dehydrogenase flavin-adding protein (antitoxin of CptAB toxin-antitoxin module)
MQTPNELINIAAKNQALLEGVKLGLNKKFQPFLKKMDRKIRTAILTAQDIQTSKKIANEIKKEVSDIQKAIYIDYLNSLDDDLIELAVQQAGIEAASYEATVVKFQSTIPSQAQLITAYSVNPLQVENYAGNPLLSSVIKDNTAKEVQRINKAISDGFSQGLTNQQISTNIRGTKANKFNDGQLARVNRSNMAITRTAVQHVSSQARMATMKANSDLVKGYKIVVTFDSGTTTLCYDIGQRDETYKVGKGPIPPLHWGCRDTIAPVLSDRFDFLDKGATRATSKGQVSVKLGSYDWMLQQPKSFQEASMGVKRVKLLRDGGLTPTEYAKLSTNSRFETLTLAEMKKKAPAVFEKAGLD